MSSLPGTLFAVRVRRYASAVARRTLPVENANARSSRGTTIRCVRHGLALPTASTARTRGPSCRWGMRRSHSGPWSSARPTWRRPVDPACATDTGRHRRCRSPLHDALNRPSTERTTVCDTFRLVIVGMVRIDRDAVVSPARPVAGGVSRTDADPPPAGGQRQRAAPRRHRLVRPGAGGSTLLADLIPNHAEVVLRRVADPDGGPASGRHRETCHHRHGVVGEDAHHGRDVVEIAQVSVAAFDRAQPMRRGRADGRIAAAVVALEQVDQGTDAVVPRRELRVRVAVARCVRRRAECLRPLVVEDVPPVLGGGRVAARARVALRMERSEGECRVDAARDERPVDRIGPPTAPGNRRPAIDRRTMSRSASGRPGSGHGRADSSVAADTAIGRASTRFPRSGPGRRSPAP